MNVTSLKYAAAVAVVTMAVTGLGAYAYAQTPVQTNLTTNSAISVVDSQDVEYGTWFLVFRNADAFTLHISTTGVASTLGLGGLPTDSQAVELTAGTGMAQVTVDLPAGLNNVQIFMQRDAIVDFADPALSLSNVTYGTATEGADQALPQATNVPVTVVNGGTPEVISFGGDIDVTALPADGVHTASFNVSFIY